MRLLELYCSVDYLWQWHAHTGRPGEPISQY
jgi:hypothetical protein